MCGIWAYLSVLTKARDIQNYEKFIAITPRGPERSHFFEVHDPILIKFGFHRLSIMDPTENGDQPFCVVVGCHTVYTICNGEIYNHENLKEKYSLSAGHSKSDCEILPQLYLKIGFEAMLHEMIGEFACLIVDIDHSSDSLVVYASRDRFGVRPLFWGVKGQQETYVFASELKGVNGLTESVQQFTPGQYMEIRYTPVENGPTKSFNITQELKSYFDYSFANFRDCSLVDAKALVRESLQECVDCRLRADRPIGCLLSGGLDSSLVAALAARTLKARGQQLRTFSIGMPGATDTKFARMVADHIGSDHTHVEFSPAEGLAALKDVIRTIESYDITTVRASTGQYLLSKWISENTDVKVLLIGDGSDELTCGYMYFHRAPDPAAAHEEAKKLLKEIHFFDVLRADRGIAGHGLEARVPFLDHRFVSLYLSLKPEWRTPQDGLEKSLLRHSFDGTNLLPEEVLLRPKEAFSDGVSGQEKSWYQIIQEWADQQISGEEVEQVKARKHLPPPSKEAAFYRIEFEKTFGASETVARVIPHFWLPAWCGDTNEPSARTLTVYKHAETPKA